MYVHPTPFFTPPVPPIAETDQGPFRFLRAVRSNALQIWPRSAYERDAIVSSHFGRKRFLLNSPKAIYRVLVENPSNYSALPSPFAYFVRSPATGCC
jgi:hypothetical protein